MIEVRDLVKRYGDHVAVDHLSFQVEKGQIYGFLGPNGAGKSTTMNIMTGYLTATEGRILVDGHDLADEPMQVKRRIGYLPEQPPLYMDMTVEEYLTFAAELKKVPAEEREQQLEQILNMVWLGDVRGRLIRNLSKGYRQRVGLAQALVGFPDILILDEPTVGLDPKQILEIRTLIRSLAKNHTVIISSHILSEIQEICDQILIIHHGKMVANGTPAQLEEEMSGPAALEVTVRGDQAALVQTVESLPGVQRVVVCTAAEEGTAKVQIGFENDVREAVFAACVEKNLPILEMRRNSLTLEEIFLKLTGEGAAAMQTESIEENEVSEV